MLRNYGRRIRSPDWICCVPAFDIGRSEDSRGFGRFGKKRKFLPKNFYAKILKELLFYGVNAFFFFISVWLMVHLAASWAAEGRGAAIMDTVKMRAYLNFHDELSIISGSLFRSGDFIRLRNIHKIQGLERSGYFESTRKR